MNNLRRAWILAALLGLLCVGIDSAADSSKGKSKSYGITVGSATKVGSVVLSPGEYKFKVEGDNATFTKEGSGKTFTIPAKLEAGKEAFEQTMLHQVNEEGQKRIVSIELKGTQTLLKFD